MVPKQIGADWVRQHLNRLLALKASKLCYVPATRKEVAPAQADQEVDGNPGSAPQVSTNSHFQLALDLSDFLLLMSTSLIETIRKRAL